MTARQRDIGARLTRIAWKRYALCCKLTSYQHSSGIIAWKRDDSDMPNAYWIACDAFNNASEALRWIRANS